MFLCKHPGWVEVTLNYFFYSITGSDSLMFRIRTGRTPDPGFDIILLCSEQTFRFHSCAVCSPDRPGHQDAPGSCTCLYILLHSFLGCWTTDKMFQSILVHRSTRRMSHPRAEPKAAVQTETAFLEDCKHDLGTAILDHHNHQTVLKWL